jgi:hypothetical protein
MKQTTFISFILMLIWATTLTAQEKYAVLITGDYVAKNIPEDARWGGSDRSSPRQEFWNDTYLMWEMLINKGYSQENIIVLFADGVDYPLINPYVPQRYKPQSLGYEHITDYAATRENIELVFKGLANNIQSISKIDKKGALTVWVHQKCISHANGNCVINLHDNNSITKIDLQEHLNQIQCSTKKLIVDGSFLPDNENNL